MLDFESARLRSDYKFTFGIDYTKITPEMFRKAMASMDMTPVVRNEIGYLHGDGDSLCMARLEVGHVDVELMFYYFVQYAGGPEEQPPTLDLYVNVETIHGWDGADLIGDPVQVDWRLPNWMEQLEREMFRQLMNRCEFMGFSVDEYNEW